MSLEDPPEALREQAEQELRQNPKGREAAVVAPGDLQHQFEIQDHELHVHKIELQLQNEELRRVNLELQEARNEYADLFDFAPVGYLTLDAGGVVRVANREVHTQLGLTRPHLVNRRLLLFMEPESRPAFAAFLKRTLELELPGRRSMNLRMLREGDAPWDARIEAVAWKGREGGRTGLRAAIMDVSAERQAQAEIQELNQTLEARVQARTAEIQLLSDELQTFVYSISHDLTKPLRHITGFSQMLVKHMSSQQNKDEKTSYYLETIGSSVGRMNALVEALIEFFRSSHQPTRRDPVDLDYLVRRIVRDLHPEQADREVSWVVAPLPTVEGDSFTLRTLFFNLLINALKFTRPREQARIEVLVEQRSGQFLIGVRDNGVGFDMRQAGRLFGFFQRLHSERDFEGNGMGLALARRIAHRHGGQLWAESQPGEGATFWVGLPQ